MKNRLIAGIWFGSTALVAAVIIFPMTVRDPVPNPGLEEFIVFSSLFYPPILTSFLFGFIWGYKLLEIPTTKQRILSTGIGIPALATVAFVLITKPGNVIINLLPPVLFGTLYLTLFAILLTGWITIPIGIISAWGLSKFALNPLKSVVSSTLVMVTGILLSHYYFTKDLLPANTPRISLTRPIGSECSQADSASIKRKQSHPSNPSGTWGPRNLSDPSRQLQLHHNEFIPIYDGIAGYVRFDQSGTLRIRSYDDLYGAVYCNWSPTEFHIEASQSKHYQYIRFAHCLMGGEIKQIHEICWFPDGETKGAIVFSSAFTDPATSQLKTSDVYTENDISAAKVGVLTNVFEIAADLIQDHRIKEANEVLDSAREYFVSGPGAINASTQQTISNPDHYPNKWHTLLLYKVGVAIANNSFTTAYQTLDELEEFIKRNIDSEKSRVFVQSHLDDLILYRWLVAFKENDPGKAQSFLAQAADSHYYDISDTAKYLNGKMNEDTYLKSPVIIRRFWIGFKCAQEDKKDCMQENLSTYLKRNGDSKRTFPYSPVETILAYQAVKK